MLQAEQKNSDLFTDLARDEVNSGKNRYRDILPYDKTRVILVENPSIPGSNYINANYVPVGFAHLFMRPSIVCLFFFLINDDMLHSEHARDINLLC